MQGDDDAISKINGLGSKTTVGQRESTDVHQEPTAAQPSEAKAKAKEEAKEEGSIGASKKERSGVKKNTRTSTVVECFPGVEPQVWEDWLAIRRAKKLPLTKTAMEQVEAEASKAGVSMQQALTECCLRGWGGFKASWMTREGGATLNKQEEIGRAHV